jgi:chemotaxis protein MotA
MVSERHKAGAAIFDAAGGFAPTMGIIGTVLGLVHVLGNLEDTSSLGGKIATAFIATLYGVGSANILWIPIANRLKAINKKEMIVNDLIIEGVIGIQDGISPNALEERLSGYLTEKKDSQAGITK